jgi:hypothetical protein
MNKKSPTPITIRDAIARDLDRLAQLNAQLGYPATIREIGDRLQHLQNHPEHGWFVAALKG